MVTSTEIREWLDKQIEAKKLQNIRLIVEEHEDRIDDYLSNLSATNYIHIGSEAVRYVAKALGLPLYVTSRPHDEQNPYEVVVFYNGERFLGIETEEEYLERGAVV